MTNYPKTAYGPNPNAGRLRNNAESRGWGSGWPHCQTSKMAKLAQSGATIYVRREVAELVRTLILVTEKRGYDVNPAGKPNQTWGFACRPIRGSNTASNHSWGLAVDINSLTNPMQSTFRSDIPPAVVHAWEICGFYWGGRYVNRPDTMHFEYIGRPADVATDLAQAKAMLTGKPPITIDARAIRAAARGVDQKDPDFTDARQFMAFARVLTDGELKPTEAAWLNTWKPGADKSRRGTLFTYAIRVVQSRAKLKQDGIFGPQTAAFMERYGYAVTHIND